MLYEYFKRVLLSEAEGQQKLRKIRTFGQQIAQRTLLFLSRYQNYEIFKQIETLLEFLAKDFWFGVFRTQSSSISKSNPKTISFNVLNYDFISRIDVNVLKESQKTQFLEFIQEYIKTVLETALVQFGYKSEIKLIFEKKTLCIFISCEHN